MLSPPEVSKMIKKMIESRYNYDDDYPTIFDDGRLVFVDQKFWQNDTQQVITKTFLEQFFLF